MRTKSTEKFRKIREFINSYCDENGYGPSVSEISQAVGMCRANVHSYLTELFESGEIARGKTGYESNSLSRNSGLLSIPVLGAVPCGPLSEVEEFADDFIRLSREHLGAGKFFFLKASGDSMINAGICPGDMVLVRQQESADEGQVIVALVDNQVTLKRLAYDGSRYYLHPENREYADIYPDEIKIQGVAIKTIKDIL